MNHLAHLHLSFGQPDLVVGNFSGDEIKGDDWKNFPEGIARGLLLHREIDAFTDSHPSTHLLNRQLRPFAGRFAGPCGDIVRDCFLTKTWPQFSPEPLRVFADQTYNTLKIRLEDIPEPLRARCLRMILADWLTRYGTREELAHVFARFQKRLLPHRLDIEGLLDFVEQHEENMLEDFRGFYPALWAHIWALAAQPLSKLPGFRAG